MADREAIPLKRRKLSDPQEMKDGNSPLNFQMSLAEVIKNAQSTDPQMQIQTVTYVRKLLSSARNPPIDDLIKSGILPILISCLQSEDATLQFETAWVFANIASGTTEQTREVIKAGAVPHFINLMSSTDEKVCEQVLWAIGNIVGDGPELRSECIKEKMFDPLEQLILEGKSVDVLRKAAWIIVNLCRTKVAPPSINLTKKLLSALSILVDKKEDVAILINVVWAFSYLSDGGASYHGLISGSGVVRGLIPLLNHQKLKVQTAVLRVLGNISTGTDEQTRDIIDVLKYMAPLLTHSNNEIVKEAVWLVANIGVKGDNIKIVIAEGIVPLLVGLLGHSDLLVKKEAARTLSNLAASGTPMHVFYLVGCEIIAPFCALLQIKETEIIHIALNGLFDILKKSSDHSKEICKKIEDCDPSTQLEALQNRKSEGICKCPSNIIENFFGPEGAEQFTSNQSKVSIPQDGFNVQ